MIQHTDECLKYQFKMKAEHDVYVSQWPNYCKSCGGIGIVTWSENQSPLGSGEIWLEDMADVCTECTDKGNCPRCGEHVWSEDELEYPVICPRCGWKDGDLGCPPAGFDEPCQCEISQWDKDFQDYAINLD